MVCVVEWKHFDAVVRQGHELCRGCWSVARIGRRDQEIWMVVDAVQKWDDGKPAEVDREDGLSMICFG